MTEVVEPIVETAPPETPEGTWFDALPQEFKDAPYFKADKTAEQVVADLKNAASWQGNSIRIPGPDATEDAKADFYSKALDKLPGLMRTPDADHADEILTKLGKPADPSDYRTPEGFGIEGDALGVLKANAHEAGLTQKQFDVLMGKQTATSQAAQEAAEASQAETYAILKEKWGMAAPDRLETVKGFVAENAPESLKAAFEAGSMDASSIAWLYDIASSTEEKAQNLTQNDGREGALTPDEAKHQAQEIWQQLYEMQVSDPRYNALKLKRSKLIAQYAG